MLVFHRELYCDTLGEKTILSADICAFFAILSVFSCVENFCALLFVFKRDEIVFISTPRRFQKKEQEMITTDSFEFHYDFRGNGEVFPRKSVENCE